MDMGIIFWTCASCVVCIIASVIFYKPYLGVVFVIVSIPFEGITDFGYISIYPLESILGVFVLICIYKSIVGRHNYFANTKLVYCCIPFVLCIMLSATKSIEISLAVKEIVRWLELFLIYFLTINLINQEKKMKIILYSMVSTVALVSTYGFITYYTNVGFASWGHRASSFFGNPNPMAGYINLMIPIIFGMLMASVSLWVRIMLGALATLSIIVWFLSFSISGWLSLILTMVLVFILTKSKKRVLPFLVIFLVIFTITFLFSDIITNFMDRGRSLPVMRSIEFRARCYSVGLDMVKGDLLFGIGTGNCQLLIKRLTENINFGFRNLMAMSHLHSLYLQVFVETGVVGLSAFVFWLVCIFKYLVSSFKAIGKIKNYSLFVGLVGGGIVYLFNSLTDVLMVHGIHLQWGIILGLAVVLTQFRESKTCLKVT
jgi:O-antigen ligase